MDQAISVHEFLEQVNTLLSVQRVLVQGEITRVDRRAGYTFFTLKDTQQEAILSCFAWEYRLSLTSFHLKEGQEIQVFGFPEIYIRSGRFNFHVEQILLLGEGALQKAFEALKKQLEQLGFFASERKKPLPRFVKNIGLITSEAGDAVKDFLTHLGQHDFELSFFNVKVEGIYAIEEIVKALRYFNEQPEPSEVLVLIRGGGSLESLQAFNSEAVARAIFASKIPVLTGIGHEKDFTIADFVADARASTPTHAGRILGDPWSQVETELEHASQTLAVALQHMARRAKDAVDTASQTLEEQIAQYIARLKEFLCSEEQKLNLASPLHRLRQGYSITMEAKTRKVVKSSADVLPNKEIVTKLYKGELYSHVISQNSNIKTQN